MNKPIPTFDTHDVDLAAYLMLEGLKFIECVTDQSSIPGRPRVLMRFFDEKGIARDLERTFAGSGYKRYRDYHKLLLKDIHRTMRGI